MGVVGRLGQYASMLAGEFDDYSMSENLVTDNATDFNYSFNNQIISTANDVAPNGLTVLCKHDLTGASSTFLNCRANTTLNAGTYTMSMYLKGTTSYSASFAFVGETTSEIYSNTANITTAWQRFTLTFTLINTQTSSRLQLFFSTQGEGKVVSVWGAQLERGSVATDYTSRPSGTAISRVLPATTNTNITGLGTYYSSGFDENVGFTTFLSANVFAPYDPVYDEFGGTLFGAGQGRYMRQNTDKSVIVYNEIDEVSDFRDIVRSGLVLDLDAGMNSSFNNTGTTWYDLSGNGNNGTLVLGPTYSSSNNGSLSFDGVDDRIDLSSAVGTVSQYTISYWAKRDAENRMPVSTINGDFYWFGDNSWRYVHGGVAGEYYYSKPTTISLGTWGYYVVTYDGSNVIIYRQGVYQGQQATTGTANFSSALRIGWWGSNTYAYLGNIANVSFYNRALSAAEITQNFNALKHRYGL